MVRPYINMDFDGLKTALIEMIAGARVMVNVSAYDNHTERMAVPVLLVEMKYNKDT